MYNQIQARIRWVNQRSFLPGRSLWFTCQGVRHRAWIMELKSLVAQKGEIFAKNLQNNEEGIVTISIESFIVLSSGERFELADFLNSEKLAEGVVLFSLRRSENICWQQLCVTKEARALQKRQRPLCLWFTGLSGSGKSTIANLLEKKLFELGRHTYLLDGDNLRHGLNRDLGFTEVDRVENIRRVTEVAKLMVDAGLVVITSFISPFRAERQLARQLLAPGEFIEIFVNTPLAECERRDVKGLYAKARRGELRNFTGIDSVYEPPENPELIMDTFTHQPETCVEQIITYLQAMPLNTTI